MNCRTATSFFSVSKHITTNLLPFIFYLLPFTFYLMKHLARLLTLSLFTTVGTVTLASCADDVELSAIVGTWMHNDSRDREYEYITFTSDGKGAKWEMPHNAPAGFTPRRETFQYVVNGNTLTRYEDDGDTDTDRIRFKGQKLIIDGDTYTRANAE